MKLRSILKPDNIITELKANSKNEVLREIAERFHKSMPHLDTHLLHKVLDNREKLGSTGIGNGIAIPHGKVAGINSLIAVFARSSVGVDFDSHDGESSRLFFTILAPEDASGSHLRALAKISRMLKNEDLRQQLLEASHLQALCDILFQFDQVDQE